MARAETALPILVLFLGQLDILGPPLGQTVLRCASLEDVAIWSVLALILMALGSTVLAMPIVSRKVGR